MGDGRWERWQRYWYSQRRWKGGSGITIRTVFGFEVVLLLKRVRTLAATSTLKIESRGIAKKKGGQVQHQEGERARWRDVGGVCMQAPVQRDD